MSHWTIHQGDCRQVLREHYPAHHFDAVITDPPYGLSREPDPVEVLVHWLAGDPYIHSNKGGFMGAAWDAFVPGPEYWREVFRVMKPGALLLAFSSTRTWDLLSIAIRLAGFECRDTIRHDGPPAMGWVQGQGFNKVGLLSKKVEGEAEQRQLQGVGGMLKPSWEVILVFRKPLDGTLVGNALKWGTGGFNVDTCRVGTSKTVPTLSKVNQGGYGGGFRGGQRVTDSGKDPNVGRWPPNVVLSHVHQKFFRLRRQVPLERRLEILEFFGAAQIDAAKRVGVPWSALAAAAAALEPLGVCWATVAPGVFRFTVTEAAIPEEWMECFEFNHEMMCGDWHCVDGCPVRLMGEQSGPCGCHGGGQRGNEAVRRVYGSANRTGQEIGKGWGKGTATRFFHQLPPEAPPFIYQAKASTKDRGAKNKHKTVKPQGLMRLLCRLGVPRGGLVLDPFAGSGTTIVAALKEGVRGVGIELEEDSAATCMKRCQEAEEACIQGGHS